MNPYQDGGHEHWGAHMDGILDHLDWMEEMEQQHREETAFMVSRHNRVESLEYQLQASDYEKGE